MYCCIYSIAYWFFLFKKESQHVNIARIKEVFRIVLFKHQTTYLWGVHSILGISDPQFH